MTPLSIASQAPCYRFPGQTRPAAMLPASCKCASSPVHVALPSFISSRRRAVVATSSQRLAGCSFHPLGELSSECQKLSDPACTSSQFRLSARGDLSWTKNVEHGLNAGGAKSGLQLRKHLGQGVVKKLRALTVVARAAPYDDGSSPVVVSSPEDRYKENGSPSPKVEASYDPADYVQRGNSSTSNTAAILRGSRKANLINAIENRIERIIFNCRFLTLFAVVGSLLGSVLCFLKGCLYVSHSYSDYIRACLGGVHTSRVILYLVEAVDVYLMGTVMLIFGMGLYELFVSSLEVPSYGCEADGTNRSTVCGSNLFGLFRIRQRPKWLEIRSLDELKTKLGHVIVMILLVGLFEKSKKVIVTSSLDFLCFSASILLSSAALYLLSILHNGSPVET